MYCTRGKLHATLIHENSPMDAFDFRQAEVVGGQG